jgi:hypothetical protein
MVPAQQRLHHRDNDGTLGDSPADDLLWEQGDGRKIHRDFI